MRLTKGTISEVQAHQEKLLKEYNELVQIIEDVHEIFEAQPVFNYNLNNAVKSLKIRILEERHPQKRQGLETRLTEIKESQITYPETFNRQEDLDALKSYRPGDKIAVPEVKRPLTSHERFPDEERTPKGVKIKLPAFCTKKTFKVPEYNEIASRKKEKQKILKLVDHEIETNLLDQKIRLANEVPGYWETKEEIENSLKQVSDVPTVEEAIKNIYDDFNDLDYKGTIDRINYIVFVLDALTEYNLFDVPSQIKHKLEFIGTDLDLNYLTGVSTDFKPLVKKLGLSLKQGHDFDLIK